MLIDFKLGQGSIVLRVKILNSSVSTGAGLTGLTSSSTSLRISTIADNESSATTYTQGGSTIETITTLGTYAAPTATKCRFKEVDATNHPGVYEIQIADARFAVSNAKSLLISIGGAANAAETDICIPLRSVDPYDSVRFGMTALPNAAANANGGLPILSSSGTTLAYTISTLTTYTGNTPQTGDAYARIGATGSGLTSLAPSSTALSTAQWTNTLATNLGTTNSTVATNLDTTVSSRSTLTQTQVTGGAYSIQSSSCVLGDARIGTTDSGITTLTSRLSALRAGYLDNLSGGAVALAATALSTAQWSATRAGYLDNLSGGAVALAATALSSATWTSARAGYLDNLNVGGAVASQSDVNAISVSATRRVLLSTVNFYERPESGSTSYQIELRTYSSTGSAVNADTTPTLTATGMVSGSLSGNLSVATNPATGVYRWTYTVASNATAEQIRFDVSATISSATFTMSTYSQVLDEVSATWTSTDATHLTAIYNKLPTNNIADQTLLNTSIAGVQSDTDDIQSRLPAALVSGRMDVSVGAMAPGVLTASAIAASALDGKGDWLLSSGYTTPPTAAANASAVRTELTTELSRIDVGISTRLPTVSYTAPLDAAGTRTALGLGVANMDTQFNAIYTVAGLVQAQTDKLLFDGSNYVKTTPQTAAVGFYQSFLIDHGLTIPQDGSVIGSIANLDLHLSSAGVTAITEGVVDQTLTGHEIVGSVGEALVHASAAGDPWDIHLPGSYADGTAGKIVGDYLDIAVSSRLAASSYTAPDNPTDYARNNVTPTWYAAPVTLTAAEVWSYPDRTLAAAALDTIMVATNITPGTIVDSDGNSVTSMNMRQAIALLMAYCAGDRTGIGTREIIAALAGETTKITATRTSQTVIQGTGVVPA